MDPRERLDDVGTAVQAALQGFQAKLWTGFPGIIVSFNAQAVTAVVQPAVQLTQTKQDGSTQPLTMPKLLDCPVQFQGGGNVLMTMPLTQGDEVWVNIANRCIDAWWQQGGVQPQMEQRLHDLSDGFCFPKVWSKPNAPANISTTASEWRSVDRSTFVQLDPNGRTVNITAPGGWSLNGPGTINGNVNQTGAYVASEEGTFNGIEVSRHVHPGVEAGGASTEPPTG